MSRPINPTALLAGAALTFALALTWQLADTTTLRAAGEQAAAQGEPSLRQQPQADIDKKSAGCLTCHTPDTKSMHRDNLARAGCTDCHGGDAGPMRDKSLAKGSPQFEQIQKQAHVQPTLDIWKDSAANPPEVWYQTIKETAEFIRFARAGPERAARASGSGRNRDCSRARSNA